MAIRQKQQEGEPIVLGLATGSTPIKVYEELVRQHKKEGLNLIDQVFIANILYLLFYKRAHLTIVRKSSFSKRILGGKSKLN